MENFNCSERLLREVNGFIETCNFKLLNRLLRLMFTNYIRYERKWLEDDFDKMLTELLFLFLILDMAEDEANAVVTP